MPAPVQDGTVLWDGREAGNTRVGLMLPQHHADAVRYVLLPVCLSTCLSACLPA